MTTTKTNGKFYTGKVHSWGLKFLGDGHKPCAEVTFVIQVDGTDTYVPYQGWLTEAAKQYTVRDLVTLGFSDPDMGRFAKGVEGGAITKDAEFRVKLVVEDYKGKQYPKIKGIYPLRASSELTFDDLAKAGKIVVAGEVMAAKAGKGISGGNLGGKAAAETKAGNGAIHDDLPF